VVTYNAEVRVIYCEREYGVGEIITRPEKRRSFMRISQILLIGIVLIVLGVVVAFAYQGIAYKTGAKVIDPPGAPSNLVVR